MQFFFFSNLLYLEPTFGMDDAKHTQTDTHDRFSKSLFHDTNLKHHYPRP